MVNPHEKVSSADQDNWVALADLMRQQLERFAKGPTHAGVPPLTPEELQRLVSLAAEVKCFHSCCLAFDAELEGLREKLLHQGCHQ